MRDHIKAAALQHGFTMREQPDGTMDLNPYVYEFAEALITGTREACARIVEAPHWKPAVRTELAKRAAAIRAMEE